MPNRITPQRSRFAGRIALCLALGALLTMAVAPSRAEELPPLPPLTDPATGVDLPGKIVWADLFVDDVEAARDFYTRMFDWSWQWITGDTRTYGVLLHDGLPVAGIAYLDPDEAPDPYGRWVHYLSTSDVEGVTSAATERGGRVLLAPRTHGERGEFSILSDPEGAIFGTIHSETGDPGDYRAIEGEWLWHVLYSRSVNASAQFYEENFGYSLFEYEWEEDKPRLILASQDYARASISPMPEEEDARPAWIGFVMTEDVPAAVARAQSLGAEVLFAPSEEVHQNGIAILADPQGGIFGLLSWIFPEEEAQP